MEPAKYLYEEISTTEEMEYLDRPHPWD